MHVADALLDSVQAALLPDRSLVAMALAMREVMNSYTL